MRSTDDDDVKIEREFNKVEDELIEISDITPPIQPIIFNDKFTNTNNSSPTITGSAEKNSIVKLFNGNSLLGSTTADAKGIFSIKASLKDGQYIGTTATDTAGNESPLSPDISIKIDTTSPNAVSLSTTSPLANQSNPIVNSRS